MTITLVGDNSICAGRENCAIEVCGTAVADALVIEAEKTLTVPTRKTLNVEGTIFLEGTLVNNGTITGRGQIVIGSSFNDVDSGAWYADAITWAVTNGIVGGSPPKGRPPAHRWRRC